MTYYTSLLDLCEKWFELKDNGASTQAIAAEILERYQIHNYPLNVYTRYGVFWVADNGKGELIINPTQTTVQNQAVHFLNKLCLHWWNWRTLNAPDVVIISNMVLAKTSHFKYKHRLGGTVVLRHLNKDDMSIVLNPLSKWQRFLHFVSGY